METKLLLGDCLELMKEIEDNSIDLILCDLPYGTTDRSGISKNGKNRLLEWDSVIDLDLLWVEYKRIIKDKGAIVLTADQPFTSKLIMSNLEWFRYEWIWKKSDLPFGQLILEGYVQNVPRWIHLSLGEPYRDKIRCRDVKKAVYDSKKKKYIYTKLIDE